MTLSGGGDVVRGVVTLSGGGDVVRGVVTLSGAVTLSGGR